MITRQETDFHLHSAALHSHLGGGFMNHEISIGDKLNEKEMKREAILDQHDEDTDSGKGEDEDEDSERKSIHKVIKDSGSHHSGKLVLLCL